MLSPDYFAGANLRNGVIGCGYVGLPLILGFAERGHRVWGSYTDSNKVDKLNAGQSYLKHIPGEKIKQQVDAQLFAATSDFPSYERSTQFSSACLRHLMTGGSPT